MNRSLVATACALCAAMLTGCHAGTGAVPIANGTSSTTQVQFARVPSGGAEFVYVTNLDGDDVSAYSVDPATGALNEVEKSPFKASYSPVSIATDATCKFVFAYNEGTLSPSAPGSISAYSIDQSSGALTQVKGSPFKLSRPGNGGVAVSPAGKFLYVTIYSGGVAAYSIAASGALTQIKGSPFAAPGGADGIAVSPTGKFAYVSVYGKQVAAFSVNTTSGALTQVKGSPFKAGPQPEAVAVDPSGKFVYVANYNDGAEGSVSAYTIDQQTGALTAIKGSPFKAGSGAGAIAADPDDKFVYVADFGADQSSAKNLNAYTINATSGALTQVKGSPYKTGSGPSGIAVDPAGAFLYVTLAGANGIFGESINATSGSLTPVKGSPFSGGLRPYGVAACRV